MMLAGRYDLFMYKTANLNTSDGGRHYDKPDDDAYNKITNGAFTFRAGLNICLLKNYLFTVHTVLTSSLSAHFMTLTPFISTRMEKSSLP